MILGCHLSIAGGLHKALERAEELALDAVALFVRNQRQWAAPPLSAEAIRTFKETRKRTGINPVLAHGSYLINLAGEGAVREHSLAALADEVDRCEQLGIDYYIFHPGSTGLTDQDEGPARVADALNAAAAERPKMRVRILLETTAAAGNMLGGTFENLAEILRRLEKPEAFGMCLDTCHIFAAGYDIRTADTYRQMMADLDRVIGLERLKAIHLNDSLRYLGSCVDRHEHIGKGFIGLEGIGHVVRDRVLAGVPMILETPKGTDENGKDLDLVNAQTVRKLAKRK